MKLLYISMLSALAVAANAGAQTTGDNGAQSSRASSAIATPYSDAYVPRSMRQPKRDITSGPVLLRFQPMQRLKQRFEDADTDGSGTLNRDEARRAGFTVVDKNFDSIDTAQRGHVTFDDLNAYLIQRREESRAR